MFNVSYVKPVYTGGGIYVYVGRTTDSRHFIADDDGGFSVVDSPFILDIDNSEWENIFQPEWMEAHETESFPFDEARQNLLSVYAWLYENGDSVVRNDVLNRIHRLVNPNGENRRVYIIVDTDGFYSVMTTKQLADEIHDWDPGMTVSRYLFENFWTTGGDIARYHVI